MAIEDQIMASSDTLAGLLAGGIFTAIFALGVLIAFLVVAAIYIYFALSYKKIAEKMKFKKSWIAWIPIAQWAMLLKLGRFNWAWIFLILIPFVGWIALLVIFIIANWRIFEALKYPGWFSLSIIIPQVGTILYAVAIGFVAWKEPTGSVRVESPTKKTTKKSKKKTKKKRK